MSLASDKRPMFCFAVDMALKIRAYFLWAGDFHFTIVGIRFKALASQGIFQQESDYGLYFEVV